MPINYYFDESGHTGDLIKSGYSLNFSNQPIFSLACIGVANEAQLNTKIESLKKKHNIAATELKSTKLIKFKPKFIKEFVEFVCHEGMPFFIEIVDKKFLICAEVINCHVVPPTADINYDTQCMRNYLADYLYDYATDEVFEKFFELCKNPCHNSLSESLKALQSLAEREKSNLTHTFRQAGTYLPRYMDNTLHQYESMKDSKDAYINNFLPLQSVSKNLKPIWILPNHGAFNNIYARINKLHSGNLKGISLIHDVQMQYDDIIKSDKDAIEIMLKNGVRLYSPNANYNFTQSSHLKFDDSKSLIGIQASDILAGLSMRCYMDIVSNSETVDLQIKSAFTELLKFSNLAKGVGVNIVTSYKFQPSSA